MNTAEPPPPPPPPPGKNNGAKAWGRKSKPNMIIVRPPIWPLHGPHPQGPVIRPPPPLPPPRPGHVWIRPPHLAPPPRPMAPSATGYGPCGFVGVGPYGYSYQCFRPAQPLPMPMPQPQPQAQLLPHPQPQVNGNIATVAAQTSVFGSLRRGTGVFLPSSPPQRPVPVPNNNNNNKTSSSINNYSNNKGARNKQGDEFTHQTRKRKKKSASERSVAVVKREECQNTPSSEMRLPKEWTY